MSKKLNLSPSIKAYLTSLLFIFIIMLVTYGLTFLIGSGQYSRYIDDNGFTLLDFAKGYETTNTKFAFSQFILSPFLVLASDGNITIIGILVFIIVIGGIFECINKCGINKYLISKIVNKYGNRRYLLIALIIFVFMMMGSFIGTFEEIVPLIPIIIALSLSLGFDKINGLAMSLIAIGFGFASGIMNSFTVGIAQRIAGLKIFSGMSLRIISFILIYILLTSFTIIRAKKIAKPISNITNDFVKDERLDKASLSFLIILAIGFLTIISSTFIKALQDYTVVILTLVFLISGIVSCAVSKMKVKEFLLTFIKGVLGIAPAILMILMASSIKYILVTSQRLDTILYYIVKLSSSLNKIVVILFIYLVVLIMNFFISSGSAKAFILIPIIMPIAQIFDISYQLCILAFAFGDGFSNVFYPTNPVTLISLQVADVSFAKYSKFALPLEILTLVLTSLILMFGLLINY